MKDLIDWHRDAQRQFEAEFISVQDLVEFYVSEHKVDYYEAAEALLALFEASDASELPRFGAAWDTGHKFVEMECNKAFETLVDLLAVTMTKHERIFADTADHYGWLRPELMAFFSEKGIAAPCHMPNWSGPYIPDPDSQDRKRQVAELESRVAALDAELSERASSEKPLGQRERDTLLCVIAALLNELKIDPYNPPRGLPQDIKRWLNEVGANMDDGTISSVLKKLPEAIEKRGY